MHQNWREDDVQRASDRRRFVEPPRLRHRAADGAADTRQGGPAHRRRHAQARRGHRSVVGYILTSIAVARRSVVSFDENTCVAATDWGTTGTRPAPMFRCFRGRNPEKGGVKRHRWAS